MSDSEIGDLYAGRRQESQDRRAKNREASPKILREQGFGFQSLNNGVHLKIEDSRYVADFWPGTGLWKIRTYGIPVGFFQGRGVYKLINQLRKLEVCKTSNPQTIPPPRSLASINDELLLLKREPRRR